MRDLPPLFPSLLVAALSGVAACDYIAPIEDSAETVPNTISGTVVVNATTVEGPVFVLLFDAADPPPPEGTGRPVDFAAIPAGDFSVQGGIASAPFALTNVPDLPDSAWLVTAIEDADSDFNPLLDATAGATCGDVLGAYLSDLSTGALGTVSVSGGAAAVGVTVVVGTPMTTERPSFLFTNDSVNRTGADPTFHLASTNIDAVSTDESGDPWEVLSITGPLDLTAYDPCDTFFLLYLPDDDGAGDGNPHPNATYASAGVPEIWPRVYMEYLGDGEVKLAEGERYVSEALWSTAVTPGALASLLASGEVAFNTAIPLTDIDLYFPSVAQHIKPNGATTVAFGANIPAGSWAITVVSITGQTWTLPNQLADLGTGADDYRPVTQATPLVME